MLNRLVFSCFVALFSLSFSAQADEPTVAIVESTDLIEAEGVKAGAIQTQIIQVTAKVIEVDYEGRSLVLDAGDGDTMALEVSEAAVNFKNIQLGDRVSTEYLESVALFATEPGLGESTEIASAVALAAEGEMPAGVMADTLQVTAVVEAIDYEERSVTLRGPLRTVTMHVDESATRFENIKQGDEVHFVYSEAIAISVSRIEVE